MFIDTSELALHELDVEQLLDVVMSDDPQVSGLALMIAKTQLDRWFNTRSYAYDHVWGKYTVIALDADYRPLKIYKVLVTNKGKVSDTHINISRG